MSFMKLVQFASRILIGFAVLLVVSCKDEKPNFVSRHDRESPHKLEDILAENNDTDQKQLIIEGIEALRAGDYRKASRLFNTALIDDPANSGLHTLNGLTYQLIAKNGEYAANDLAEAGFLQAKKFNPNNTFASMQLGRVRAERKDYFGAQEEFSEVLLIEPSNLDALYELATVSYLAGDMRTARMSVDRLLKSNKLKPEYIRAGALIYAALGLKETANRYLAAYMDSDTSNKQKNYLERRVNDWHNLHVSGNVTVAQLDPSAPNFDVASPSEDFKLIQEQEGIPPTPPEQTGAEQPSVATPAAEAPAAGAPPAPAVPAPAAQAPTRPQKTKPKESVYEEPFEDMVVIDAVVLRVSEVGTTRKGNNILNNFNLTIAPYTKLRAKHAATGIGAPNILGTIGGSVTGVAPTTPDGRAKIFTEGITLSTITYSLNMANVTRQYLEIIGRPTLTAKIGKPASFFSGTDLKVAIAGNFGGNITQSPTGVTLKVTPLSVEHGYVTLDVELIGSLLTDPLTDIFERSGPNTPLPFGVGRSNVKTSVRVKLGETVMLGGTVDRVDQDTSTGVPFLEKIPILQYFFSDQSTDSQRKSVMYLITPRGYRENLRETKNYFARGEEFVRRGNLTDLEKRYKDWFDPPASQVIVLRDLGPIYRDFRTGDVIELDWFMVDELEQVLTQLVDFLWY